MKAVASLLRKADAIFLCALHHRRTLENSVTMKCCFKTGESILSLETRSSQQAFSQLKSLLGSKLSHTHPEAGNASNETSNQSGSQIFRRSSKGIYETASGLEVTE
jgi:hypothetical protein